MLTVMSPSPEPAAAASSSADEVALVTRLRSGDESAFEETVRRYGPPLAAVLRRYLPDEHEAQDALQDAFLSAFKALPRFQGESTLGTWLHRIAVNAALMKLRTRRRRPERPIDDLLPSYLEDGHRAEPRGAWSPRPDEVAVGRENVALVRRAIDQLPESYRTVLLLRDIDEHTTEETAELLELSVANVKTRLHRARQALRELLDQELGGKQS
jgi:RNA polymerase sigma-70 factor (ECF subfamily)